MEEAEGRGDMTTRVRKDAMRLLQVVNEHQAKDREGAEVVPYEVASYAELDPTSAYYDAALDYLTAEGAGAAREHRLGRGLQDHPAGLRHAGGVEQPKAIRGPREEGSERPWWRRLFGG
jgi:hypothetical protein